MAGEERAGFGGGAGNVEETENLLSTMELSCELSERKPVTTQPGHRPAGIYGNELEMSLPRPKVISGMRVALSMVNVS